MPFHAATPSCVRRNPRAAEAGAIVAQPNDKKRGPAAGTPAFDWRWLLWGLVVVLLVVYWQSLTQSPAGISLSYTEFKQAVREDRVAEVTIKGQQVTGKFKETVQGEAEPEGARPARLQRREPRYFETTLPSADDPELLALLESHGVIIRAQSAEAPWWQRALIGLLPWLVLIGLILYGLRRMQQNMQGAGPQQMFGFGKSKAKRFRHGSSDIGFDDVAGLANAKQDLREIIGYLREPERYRKLGAKIPRGILLSGPPGTGKTLLAKAVAGEADVPFYSISASEFIEMFVGVGASRVRDMFDSAKKEAPAIIFIDELDAVGRARGTGVGGGHDEREQTLNQILGEMDGFQPHEAVVVLAATNRPDVLDPALLRPGRFDRKVTLDLPDKQARHRILQVHAKHVPLDEEVDLMRLAERTVGFSGADLENLVNEAALLTAREHKDKVTLEILDQARDKIVLGAEREALISDQEKELLAYHESGHALMAWLLPHADPLDKITIIPRGRALGATQQTPEEERHNYRESYLRDRIAVMLGGRASERVVYGEVSSGAEQDLRQASALARRMVAQWGMSEQLGAVAFRQGEEHVFLGREMTQQRDYSERTAELIDEEVRSLIGEQEARAEGLLAKNRPRLDALVQRLLKDETLQREDLLEIFRSAGEDGGPSAQGAPAREAG